MLLLRRGIMKYYYLVLFALLLSSRGGGGDSSPSTAVASNTPDTVTTSTADENTYPSLTWETQSPENVNMAESGINQALDYAFSGARNTQRVVIVRHGLVVEECYARGKSKESLYNRWSTGKSVTSDVIGVCLLFTSDSADVTSPLDRKTSYVADKPTFPVMHLTYV